MATEPEEQEAPEPVRQRAARIIGKPIADRSSRAVTSLAIAAGLASLAPLPAGPIAAALIVVVAFDRGKR